MRPEPTAKPILNAARYNTVSIGSARKSALANEYYGFMTSMKWIKFTLIALAVLAAIAIAAPFLVNLDRYIPQIESAASDKLKEPVSIKGLSLRLLPVPHVTIHDISIGAGDITVGKVRLTPALLSLLSSTRIISSIEVDSLVLTQKAADKIPAWTKGDGAAPAGQQAQIRVESIRLDNAQLKLDKINFGPFDARINLDDRGVPRDASIYTLDHKLKAEIKPDNSNYTVEIRAKAWTLPAGPPVIFDELTVDGTATLKGADFSQASAKLYGGTVNGRAAIDWQKGVRLSGNFEVSQVELTKLAALFSPTTHLSGKLNAKPVFSANAGDMGQLAPALHLETPFDVSNGVIHGVDIQKAATHLITREAAGGETRFDELSGHLNLERGDMHFTGIRISSGSLAVDGDVNVSAKKELSGRINTQVKALGTSTSVPLNVAGTVDLPLLYPTGATLGGAAVGTALLGPGLGTAVGAKAGNFVEGLFDKKDAKKPKN
jgi:uncharacterized protein involved in outer membrane biogenesis